MNNISKTLKSEEDPGSLTSFNDFEICAFDNQEEVQIGNGEEEEEKGQNNCFVIYFRIISIKVISFDIIVQSLYD
jgi:hypothetical protein